jgi:hypothetical protein
MRHGLWRHATYCPADTRVARRVLSGDAGLTPRRWSGLDGWRTREQAGKPIHDNQQHHDREHACSGLKIQLRAFTSERIATARNHVAIVARNARPAPAATGRPHRAPVRDRLAAIAERTRRLTRTKDTMPRGHARTWVCCWACRPNSRVLWSRIAVKTATSLDCLRAVKNRGRSGIVSTWHL